MRAFVALLVLIALAVGGYVAYVRSQPPPVPAEPEQREGLDPDVARLVDGLLERVRAAPGKAGLHADLALAYEANDMWAEARRSFANAVALDARPLYELHLAIAQRQAGEMEASLETLRRAARRLAASGPALASAAASHRLGVVLLEEGDLDGAERAFREVLRTAPRLPGAEKVAVELAGYLGLGETFVEKESYDQAVQMLELVLREDSSIQGAHYALGLAYRGLGMEAEAERELRLGIGAKRLYLPDPFASDLSRYKVNYSGRINLAADHLEAGRPAVAAQLLESMRRSHPDDPNVLSSLAAARLALGEHAEAESLLSAARELADDEFAIPLYLSEALQGLGRYPEALVEADRAIALAPAQSATHYRRAQVLSALRDYPQAYAALLKTVELDPEKAEAYLGLAELCVHMEQLARAEEYYLLAVEKAPFSLPAHVSLAGLRLRMGRPEDAEQALIAAEKIAPDHPRVVALRERLEAER